MANIAFLYNRVQSASTVYDHIEAFSKYSKHNIAFFNLYDLAIDVKILDTFDAIVMHYTISVMYEELLPSNYRFFLHNCNAVKVAFIQDEYRRVDDVIRHFNYLGIDILFTCVPESEWEKVYPKSKLSDTTLIQTLTGYVPEALLKENQRPEYEERSLDVVYRARRLSAWYGRLSQEKWKIAEKFSLDAGQYSLKSDISYREQDRLYGEEWIKFLLNAKAALGCESGASVFDFSGEIQRNVERYEQNHPNATFEEIESKFFKGLDGQIYINQISPRCFECAALGTLMILYEGDYSGILQPWKHYVPLKKDHSNMPEVVATLQDKNRWQKIVDSAYEEIASNPDYSYQKLVLDFDTAIDKHTHGTSKSAFSSGIINSASLSSTRAQQLNHQNFSFLSRVKQKIAVVLTDLPPPIGRPLTNFFKAVLRWFREMRSGIFVMNKCGKRRLTYKLFNKSFKNQLLAYWTIVEYLDMMYHITGQRNFDFDFKIKGKELEIIFDEDLCSTGKEDRPTTIDPNTAVSIKFADCLHFPERYRNSKVALPDFYSITRLFNSSPYNFFSRYFN